MSAGVATTLVTPVAAGFETLRARVAAANGAGGSADLFSGNHSNPLIGSVSRAATATPVELAQSPATPATVYSGNIGGATKTNQAHFGGGSGATMMAAAAALPTMNYAHGNGAINNGGGAGVGLASDGTERSSYVHVQMEAPRTYRLKTTIWGLAGVDAAHQPAIKSLFLRAATIKCDSEDLCDDTYDRPTELRVECNALCYRLVLVGWKLPLDLQQLLLIKEYDPVIASVAVGESAFQSNPMYKGVALIITYPNLSSLAVRRAEEQTLMRTQRINDDDAASVGGSGSGANDDDLSEPMPRGRKKRLFGFLF